MTVHQQRVVIILVLCGFFTLLVNQGEILKEEQTDSFVPPEITQQISDYPLLFFQKLNINQATRGELLSVPQIGPVLAGRIIDYRMNHGLFENLNGLKQVQGIGDKTVQNLQQYIYVAP